MNAPVFCVYSCVNWIYAGNANYVSFNVHIKMERLELLPYQDYNTLGLDENE